jgi:hypothetical protein
MFNFTMTPLPAVLRLLSGASIDEGELATLSLKFPDISYVRFFEDGLELTDPVLFASLDQAVEFSSVSFSLGTHTVVAIAYDINDQVIGSYPYTFTVNAVTNEPIQGTLFPEPYYGYSQIEANDLTINDIHVQEGFVDGVNRAPYALCLSIDLTIDGNRLHTNKPVRNYEHAHIDWTVTYEDGSPIEYFGEIKKYTSQIDYSVINPYTDMYGPEWTGPVRKEGRYKAKVDVYVPDKNNPGFPIHRTFEKVFEFLPNNQNKIYFAGLMGDDSKDGLDPNGFGNINGTFTAATRILNATGAFASYDHAAATSVGYDNENTNWIYFDGAIRRIESKLSDDELLIDAAFAPTSDLTNVNTSTGPKAWLKTNSQLPDNVAVLLAAGQSFDVDEQLNVRFKTGHFTIDKFGAGAPPELYSSTLGEVPIVNVSTTESTSSFPELVSVGNITAPLLSKRQSIFDGSNSTALLTEHRCLTIADRIIDANGEAPHLSGASMRNHSFFWGNTFNGKQRKHVEQMTVVASSPADTVITFETPFDVDAYRLRNPDGEVTIKIYENGRENGRTHYRRALMPESGSVTSLTLKAKRDTPATMPTLAAGTEVDVCETRGSTIHTESRYPEDRIRMIGNIVTTDADDDVYDHHWYANSSSHHNHFAYNAMLDGEGANMGFNVNVSIALQKGWSMHDNFFRECNWAVEGGNGLNTIEDEAIEDVYIANNIADESVTGGFLYAWLYKTFFMVGNKLQGSNIRSSRAFASMGRNAKDRPQMKDLFPADELGYVLERNEGDGIGLWSNNSEVVGDEGYNHVVSIETYRNQMRNLSPSAKMLSLISLSNTNEVREGTEYAFVDDVIYAPNIVDNKPANIDGEGVTVAELLVDVANTGVVRMLEKEPDHQDPDNGNYEPNIIPKWALYNPLQLNATVGDVISIDLNNYANGNPTSWTASNLADGWALSEAGILSRDSMSSIDLVNPEITMTNEHGSTLIGDLTIQAVFEITNYLTTDVNVSTTTQFRLDTQIDLAEGESFSILYRLDGAASIAAGRTSVYWAAARYGNNEGPNIYAISIQTGNSHLSANGDAIVEIDGVVVT